MILIGWARSFRHRYIRLPELPDRPGELRPAPARRCGGDSGAAPVSERIVDLKGTQRNMKVQGTRRNGADRTEFVTQLCEETNEIRHEVLARQLLDRL
jgi:hypothetical protein